MELIEKVKKALIDSGFPLEMKIAKILRQKDWSVSVGRRYEDFETNMLREIDIVGEKSINGIRVHLFAECKKSDNKQLVLYAPNITKSLIRLLNPVKYFPKLEKNSHGYKMEKKLLEAFSQMPLMNEAVPVSNNIIFTKGEKVEQNNDSFFSALNGLLKYSIISGSDGYISTEFQIIFLHGLIYDGVIYQVKESNSDEFNIEEVAYGQYEFRYKFKFPKESIGAISDIVNTSRFFSHSNVIEILHPTHMELYIDTIEKSLLGIPKMELQGWGQSMEDYKENLINKNKK